MASTQLQSISELVSRRDKRSSKKKSEISLVTDSNRSMKSVTKRKRKLQKTRQTLRKKQLPVSNVSSASGSEMAIERRKKKKKRRSKRQSSQSVVESLAAVGREYGNNVSKRNIEKVSERPHIVKQLGQGVLSKTAASREYGDFFSWKTGLAYLEEHRIDQIQSKGIKRFADEYLKKLERCEEFESGHNVQPFASARLQLLKRAEKNNVSQDSGNWKYGAFSNADGHDDKNVESAPLALSVERKNISVAAMKTIGLIQKFKNGESIEADLRVNKKKENSATDVTKASAKKVISNRNRSRNSSNAKEVTTAAEISSIENTEKAKEMKTIIDPADKMEMVKKSTTEKYDTKISKSLEKFVASSVNQNKVMERLPSIEETPSEGTIDISLGQKPTDDSFELPKRKDDATGKVLSGGRYVLVKKVLTSSENTLTIVDGKKRYDSKNRSVESHFAGKMPIRRTSSVEKSGDTSMKTLYEPPRDKRMESVDKRIQ